MTDLFEIAKRDADTITLTKAEFNAAVAAAVAAEQRRGDQRVLDEREAIAAWVSDAADDGEKLAAAIRARNGAGRK